MVSVLDYFGANQRVNAGFGYIVSTQHEDSITIGFSANSLNGASTVGF